MLLTGSTGLLGSAVLRAAPDTWEVVGLQRRLGVAATSPGVTHIAGDITDTRFVREVIADGRFDVVVHAAGEGSVDAVEKDVSSGRRSIVSATEAIAEGAGRAGARLIYISSNAVFSGSGGPFDEASPTQAVNTYGRLKLEAERVCLEQAPSTLVLRPILMYGWPSHGARGNPVTMVVESLRAGRTVRMVNDVWENPLYNIEAGRAIWSSVKHEPSGIIHLAGAERVHRAELARHVAEVFDLDEGLIEEVGSDAFPGIAARPPDTTFITRRMTEDLGIHPLPLREGLQRMRASEAS